MKIQWLVLGCIEVNIHRKALDEIYKIYMLLHRSDLKIQKNIKPFRIFRQKFANFTQFRKCSLNFAQSLMKFCRNFANLFENVEKS